VAQGLRPDVVVLDPPRKGSEEAVLRAIADASPRRVVYVSCDPATLARDAKILSSLGYRPDACQPVDMFCWTGHMETVLLLSKIKTALHIDIDLDMMELYVTKAETKATYEEIKAYVLEHTGLKVSCLYIAQVKAKHGIIERDCYNKPKTEGNRVPQCPPEKEKAIEDALRHFQMITD
jgi:23S rRNA (uracil1939-C5)-methyltransferase